MRSSSIAAPVPQVVVIGVAFLLCAVPTAWSQKATNGEDDPANKAKSVPSSASSSPAGEESSSNPDAQQKNEGGTTQAGEQLEATAMPTNLRLRQLEQRVQSLKERAWRAKARVGMLKEAILGGGVGATATVIHKSKMGNSFRLVQLVYALDGAQVFSRKDDAGVLHKNKEFEILTGPIAPGSHTISVLAVYRGHGYGVFKYLTKYKFTVRSSHTFTASEGKATRIEAVAFERGGVTTPLEDRPAIDFKVSHSQEPGEN